MATPPVSDERLREVARLVQEHGSPCTAARATGASEATMRRHWRAAIARGIVKLSPPTPGFEVVGVTTKTDQAGNVTGQFIREKPAQDRSPFTMPEGHTLKGVSALVDADGNVSQAWYKTREDGTRHLEEALHEAFNSYTGLAQLPEPPLFTDDDLLTVIPLADVHLGLFAWGRETGADYDLKIAADLLKSCVSNLVARSAASRTGIILDLGDYFHGDNSQNRTSRSGHALDVDTRYARVIQIGVELAVWAIELALQKYERVVYRKLPGNHDDETSLMLAIALSAWFRENERVEIDTSPSRFFMYRHGRCMVAATHGDMLKMGDMAGYMAATWPQEWGATEYRYAFTGHVHNERVKTSAGVRVESFNTIAAKDAWSSGMGFTSPRNMVAITLHKERGEIDRLTVAVPR